MEESPLKTVLGSGTNGWWHMVAVCGCCTLFQHGTHLLQHGSIIFNRCVWVCIYWLYVNVAASDGGRALARKLEFGRLPCKCPMSMFSTACEWAHPTASCPTVGGCALPLRAPLYVNVADSGGGRALACAPPHVNGLHILQSYIRTTCIVRWWWWL